MNEESCPPNVDPELVAFNRCIDYYVARDRPESVMTDEIIYMIIRAALCGTHTELREFFAMLHDLMESHMRHGDPDLQKCRLWNASIRTYHRVVRLHDDSDWDSFKDLVITQLERDLSQFVDQTDLLISSIIAELDECEQCGLIPTTPSELFRGWSMPPDKHTNIHGELSDG